ncbi:MAG: PepSY domain-containing protein [Eggerthellaceae bacterium]|nr:PepSY domain-containing protein [Eggerthellaceae bacterium]
MNKRIIALVAAAALAACLGLAGCGGSQSSSTSAASSSAASASAASASAASASAASTSAASSTAAPASSAAASTSAAAASPAAASPAASYIGDQAAMEIALADAGFTTADVTELEVELDLDDAVVHYDVNFKQGGLEYDYDIDATSGAILSATSEVDD